jgi:hypothetical protein
MKTISFGRTAITPFCCIRRSLKNLFFTKCLLLSIIFSCQTQNTPKVTRVEITPLGPSDKPISKLIISDVKQFLIKDEDWTNLVITDKNTFQATVNYIQEHNFNNQYSDETHLEFGCFKVSMYNKDLLITSYILKSHQISKQYLKELINMLNENKFDKKLIEDIHELIVRIDY